MNNNILLIMLAGVLAMLFSFWKTSWINKQSQGNDRMKSMRYEIRYIKCLIDLVRNVPKILLHVRRLN